MVHGWTMSITANKLAPPLYPKVSVTWQCEATVSHLQLLPKLLPVTVSFSKLTLGTGALELEMDAEV